MTLLVMKYGILEEAEHRIMHILMLVYTLLVFVLTMVGMKTMRALIIIILGKIIYA